MPSGSNVQYGASTAAPRPVTATDQQQVNSLADSLVKAQKDAADSGHIDLRGANGAPGEEDTIFIDREGTLSHPAEENQAPAKPE
jgi:hypothetical protein